MIRENPRTLAAGLAPYRSTAVLTQDTVPVGLLADHRTKAGVWGLIHVRRGRLRYIITDPARRRQERLLTPDSAPGVVEPGILHHVAPDGEVEFLVEFWRASVAP